MTDLDLLYSEVEKDLRTTVRAVIADSCDAVAVAAMYDGDRSASATLWRRLAGDVGVSGLLVPESDGGAGASAREASVVCEEIGRAVAPVPFLTSAVIATELLSADGSLRPHLADGSRVAALAVPLSLAPFAPLPALSIAGDRISGRVTSVAGALEADLLLVPVQHGDRLAVHAVRASDTVVAPVPSLDMSRQLADIELDHASTEIVLDDAEGGLRGALRLGAAMLASEQVGIARWCLEATVAYLKERRQFGRVVGGLQALKHRLAHLYVGVESGAATARYAAACVAAGDEDADVAIAVAQAFCSDLAVWAAEEAVQLHGGIGMTWEHPAHLYLKRAKADQIALGTPGAHRSRLAELIPLPGVRQPS